MKETQLPPDVKERYNLLGEKLDELIAKSPYKRNAEWVAKTINNEIEKFIASELQRQKRKFILMINSELVTDKNLDEYIDPDGIVRIYKKLNE